MIICRPPKNGAIKKIHLEFSADAELDECIKASIKLAKNFSEKLASCQVVFKFEGILLEVSEFSNPADISSYFLTRRRMSNSSPMSGYPA